MPTWIKIAICVVVPLVVWFLPTAAIPIPDLSVIEQRVVAIFLAAVLLWVLEPVPIFATSILVIGLLVGTCSNGAPFFMRGEGAAFGTLLDYKAVIGHLASSTVILFLGGFFLAAAATKYRLDINLARVLITPFGSNPKTVILGLMVITAIFSMFMSNTATTAMMLAVVAPVLMRLDADDPGRIAMALAIPVAANIGGMGTPIGTPPNAVAIGTLNRMAENGEIAGVPGFGGWMAFAVPLVAVLMVIAWVVLLVLFTPKAERLKLDFEGRWATGPKAWTVYLTGVATILLWLFGGLVGMPSGAVALLPICIFCLSGVMTAADLKNLSWDVLWLIAGGFALGGAMQSTGFSAHLVAAIPFDSLPALLLLIVAGTVTLTMATFMSHTATANLLVPLMASLGVVVGGLDSIGGAVGLVLGVTFAASLGMALPISTPPNAMAHATGMVTTRHLAKAGGIICIIGLALSLATVLILTRLDIIG